MHSFSRPPPETRVKIARPPPEKKICVSKPESGEDMQTMKIEINEFFGVAARPPPELERKSARPPPEDIDILEEESKELKELEELELLKELEELEELEKFEGLEKSCRPPPESIDLCMARPPPEDLDLLNELMGEGCRPPPELEKGMIDPDSLIERRLNRLKKNIPVSESIFASMKFFIIWYDQNYPYGEYTGYQDHITSLLNGVPIKIENDYQKAIRQLNTSFSNTKYLLIATGKKKKKLVKEVHEYTTIQCVFIIKPFVEKVEKWSKALKKIQVVRNFSELLGKISCCVRSKKPTGFKHPAKTLLNYKVCPDPMIMSQQSVIALNSELQQEADQLKFKDYYQLALQAFQEQMQRVHQQNNENPISDLIDKFSISTSLKKKDISAAFLQFLDLSLYFDESKHIISGISLGKMSKMEEPKNLEIDKLIESIKTLGNILNTEKIIDENKYEKELEKLHEALYSCIVFIAIQEFRNYSQWKDFHMMKMLLNDLDMCSKSFLHFSLLISDFENLGNDLFHASVVSDSRVSVLKEFWDEWKERTIPPASRLPATELDLATKAIAGRTAVILNSTGLLNDLGNRIPKSYLCLEYRINRDFLVDWENQKRLAYKLCYIVVEDTLTPSEFNTILDVCIAQAITPIFIMLLPEHSASRIAKEMFKGRWTVTFVYCESFGEICGYMEQIENNLDRDMWQYSQCYDNFQPANIKPKKVTPSTQETDPGWELLTDINPEIFTLLVGESSLGTKLTGSLHYYFYKEICAQKQQNMYWECYASLFGITNKYVNVLDATCAKMHLRAYTLQTQPPFYKMLNDAFRTCNPDQIAHYRSFFTSLHDEIKEGVMKKYIGFVYRGTFFKQEQLDLLKEGKNIYLTCFTSTSKCESVAREFSRKTGRNVLLEIELDPKANSNVDLHSEKCSLYPEEQEVLLLPFSHFEIKRIFKEDHLTVLSLKEIVPEHELMTIKGIEYYNQFHNYFCHNINIY